MKKLLFALLASLFVLNLGFSATTITWINPFSNNNYYWEGNLTLNLTTNENANCSYELYNTSTKLVGPINFSIGQNSTIHLTNISIDSLNAAQNISIITFCYNTSNTNDNTTSTRTFLRDINDADCSGQTSFVDNSLTHSWVLGHDLHCNQSTFNPNGGVYEAISLGFVLDDNDLDILDCNGHTIEGNGTGLAISIYESNKQVKNCIIKNFEVAILISPQGINIENTTLDNNTFLNITSTLYPAIWGDDPSVTYPYYMINTTIVNNNFYNTINAINISRITNSLISNNYLENTTYYNLYIFNYSSNLNITNNTFKNSQYGLFIDNTNTLNLQHNNFINISSLKFIDKNNINIINNNNYWGHSECSLFKYLVDSNTIYYIDLNPVSEPNNWSSTKNCLNSTFENISIRKSDGTQTYNPVNPVNWFVNSTGQRVNTPFDIYLYYYDSNKNNIIIDFNISLQNYIITNISVDATNSFQNTSCYSLGIFNLTAPFGTEGTYRINLTITNESCFTTQTLISPDLRVLTLTVFLLDNKGTSDTFILSAPYNLNITAIYPLLSGNTTDLSTINDYTNIQNLTFEIINFSKITFLENVSLTDMNFVEALLDLAEYISLNQTEVSLNSSELNMLNKTTEITFYNITSNLNQTEIQTKILMDGQPCNSCNITYYDNSTGLLTFTVSHWTTYEVDAQPPKIISKGPSGTLDSSTTTTILTATTNENAICKYDISQKSFENMSYTFDGNQTSHTKSISVSAGSSYTYYVLCQDRLNNTMLSPETISFSVSSTTSSTSSGGSSGGGYISTTPELKPGKSLSMKLRAGGLKYFKIKTGERHKLRVKSVYQNMATIVLESEPIELTLSVNESRDVDLNSDNIYDITVTLNSIENGYANITIKDYVAPQELETTQQQPSTEQINNPEPEEPEPNQPQNQEQINNTETPQQPEIPQTQEQPQSSTKVWVWIISIVVLITILIIFFYKFNIIGKFI